MSRRLGAVEVCAHLSLHSAPLNMSLALHIPEVYSQAVAQIHRFGGMPNGGRSDRQGVIDRLRRRRMSRRLGAVSVRTDPVYRSAPSNRALAHPIPEVYSQAVDQIHRFGGTQNSGRLDHQGVFDRLRRRRMSSRLASAKGTPLTNVVGVPFTFMKVFT